VGERQEVIKRVSFISSFQGGFERAEGERGDVQGSLRLGEKGRSGRESAGSGSCGGERANESKRNEPSPHFQLSTISVLPVNCAALSVKV
jgi:hypothetical protein